MSEQRKVTVSRLQRKKRDGRKITMLTAYDSAMAQFINAAGVDIVLVSDAVGTVGLGRPEAVSVTVEEMITRSLAVPTIGIGAGDVCDGQALVTQDMLGLYKEMSPRFLKVYLDLSQIITKALTEFREEVEQGAFPTAEHTYTISEGELNKLLAQMGGG